RGLWLFDCGMKREFSKLRVPLARLGIDLLIVPAHALRFNPLQVPDGLSPRLWVATAASFLARSLGLPPGATRLLHNYIHRLYEESGILDGGKCYPTLFDLHEMASNDRITNAAARQALIDDLNVVLFSFGSIVLGYRQAWQSRDLADRQVNFNLGGLPT